MLMNQPMPFWGELLSWSQDHFLAIAAVVISCVLIYHYILEREHGLRLSRKYRNSIYEAQSKVFLSATQHLIEGNKDLAIKEFISAMDLNQETLDTYFALGKLFRSNGEIDKAIGLHRSILARQRISEVVRVQALKELAIDFDKGGFIDKAIETYKDVLKINRDQAEVIRSLCRIFEDIEDWEQAYHFRIMLSKVTHENQSETISHILVQKAKKSFERGKFADASEDVDDAFRFAPTVSAKIQRLKLQLIKGEMLEAQNLLGELIKEHPMYASFVFVSLNEKFHSDASTLQSYQERLLLLKERFLSSKELLNGQSSSITLSQIRLLKEMHKGAEAYEVLAPWVQKNKGQAEVLRMEYIKTLIDLGRFEEAAGQTKELLNNLNQSLTRHFCGQCGYNSDDIFWRCPKCYAWESIQFRFKL